MEIVFSPRTSLNAHIFSLSQWRTSRREAKIFLRCHRMKALPLLSMNKFALPMTKLSIIIGGTSVLEATDMYWKSSKSEPFRDL